VSGFQFATMQDVKRIARAIIRSERSLRGKESGGVNGANRIWHPFKNTYAGTIPAYSLVEIVDCIAVPGLDLTYYTVTRPSTTFRGPSWYAVTSGESVAQNGTGQLRFEGTCRIAYDSGTPAKFETYGVKPSQFTASKGFPGLAIAVHRIENSTRKWMLGTLEPANEFIGKLAGSLSQGSTAAVTIWAGAGGSEAATSFSNITCRDWLMKSGATAIASGKKVVVRYINGTPYVVEAECA